MELRTQSKAEFGPLHIYDYGSVLVDQLLEGNLNLLEMRPWQLSVEEREGIRGTIKKGLPDNPLVNTVVDLATDPFVWLGVLLSARVPLKGPGELFQARKAMNATLRENMGFLQPIRGAYTGQQYFQGAEETMRQVEASARKRNEHHEWAETFVRDPMNAWAAKHNKNRLTDDPLADAMVNLYAQGYYNNRPETVYKMVYKAYNKHGELKEVKKTAVINRLIKNSPDKLKIELKEVQGTASALLADKAKVEKWLSDRGLLEVAKGLNRFYDEDWVRMLGDADAYAKRGEFKVDPTKAVRIYRNMNRRGLEGAGADALGMDLVRELMGHRMVNAMDAGVISEDQWLDMLTKVSSKRENYRPWNNFRTVQMRDRRIEDLPEETQNMIAMRDVMRPTGAAIPRNAFTKLIDPDTLQRIQDEGLGSEILPDVIIQTRNKIAKITNQNQAARVFMPSELKSFEKYRNRSGTTQAFYLDSPDPEAIALHQRNTRLMNEQGPDRVKQIKDNPLLRHQPGRGGLQKSYADEIVDDDATPRGGWTAMDLIYSGYHRLNDPGAKDTFLNVIWPLALDRWNIKQAGMSAAVGSTKKHILWAMDHGMEKILKLGGGPGEQAAKDLKAWAQLGDEYTNRAQAATMARRFQQATYSGALSVPAGALVNAFQVINLFGHLPTKHVLEGVADAFKEMGRYAELRRKVPGLLLGPENRVARRKLLQAAFEGEDVMGLSDDAMENIENIAKSSFVRGQGTKVGRAIDLGSDLFLKLFSTTEIFNRAVAYNAHKRFVHARGGSYKNPMLRTEARRLIQETQFGSQLSNTPLWFADKRNAFGKVPALRQFMSFPLRSATAPVYNGWLYAARVAAASAVTYELGKAAGLDLSPVGFFGVTTSAYRDYGAFSPFPAPPILTIPANILGAITTGDMMGIQSTVPILFPGGLAMSKAISALAPNVRDVPVVGDGLGLMQKTYVDWANRAPNGHVPMFKSDGSFLGYTSGLGLMAKATGLDRLQFKTEQELAGYLVKHREEIVKAKQELLDKLAQGDVQGAKQVSDEFRRTQGWELQVSKQDVRRRLESLATPRTTRAFETMPSDFRQYAESTLDTRLGGGLSLGDEPARMAGFKSPEEEKAAMRTLLEFQRQQLQASFSENVKTSPSQF